MEGPTRRRHKGVLEAGRRSEHWHEEDQGRTTETTKGAAIMRLTTATIVTADGVMQGLGGPEEDRRGGSEHGGWAMPYNDNETMGFLNDVNGRADAFLFG